MTAHVPARQPFAALDSPRLQNLANTKNRQNSVAIPTSAFSFASPAGKQLAWSPSKRRHAPSAFDDDFDSENVDPALFNSPTKRSKTSDGTPKKASKFILTTATDAVPSTASSARFSSPLASVAQTLKPSSVPTKSSISNSRGSPKHKRVGLLSKRRSASSPFTRVDPPSFARSPRHSAALPFSIDAALSGTIPSYAPSPKVDASKPTSSDLEIPTLEEALPNGWFFEIHEDTPEQEATNLMEHSAGVLDISSDDDSDTKARNEACQKGKENIPPPDCYITAASAPRFDSLAGETSSPETVKPSRLRRKLDKDAMEEDRSPLSDLPTSNYFGDGLDANSHVVVDGVAPEKGSSLSKECTFDPDEPADDSETVSAVQPVDADTSRPEEKVVDFEASSESEEFIVYDETADVAEKGNAAEVA